ncbi:autotransporter outer membrane beta-barrel domain-containing protein [Selenomonadales bacterium OttesenSCG-928-I06]|nr:autotransporter outer membrane beta-barrel domain-containing protein [Selenomonadales bacterium OttesenSCG-928-I06]
MNKKNLQNLILFNLSCFMLLAGSNVYGVEVPQNPANSGQYYANGVNTYDDIPHTANINNILTASGAIISVSNGATTINGVSGDYTMRAQSGSQITINGDLTATVGAGDTWYITNILINNKSGAHGILANGENSKITLNGKTNIINSVSSYYYNAESVFFAFDKGQVYVNGDYTKVTVNQSQVVACHSAEGVVKISNGKSGSESALLKAVSSSSVRMIHASNDGQIILDRVELDGISSTNNGRMLYSIGTADPSITTQSKITFLGGSFNCNEGANAVGATALETSRYGEIEVKGYKEGFLTIRTSANNEPGIRSSGGSSVAINTGKYADFVTTITTQGGSVHNNLHGIAAGSLALAGSKIIYYGGEYANTSVDIYGTAIISTAKTSSYGLKVMGDGAKIGIYAVDGQLQRSSLYSSSTAIKFASANGYSVDINSNAVSPGQQLIHLENIDITHDGNYVSNTDGFYSGNLIQVGSHTQEITTDGAQNNSSSASGIINVADAVKNSKLELINSTANVNDASGKDLINVTYGGGTANVVKTASSDLTLDAVNSNLKGSVFTDYTITDDGKASKLNLNLSGNSVWTITRDSAETNSWQETDDVSGNFITDLNLNNSSVVFQHLDGETQDENTFRKLYVAGNYYSENNGRLEMNVVLGNDYSNTDKLIIGGNTSGTTSVYFNNIGGLGDKTDIGIEVIEVLGDSEGIFLNENAVVAGLYEYSLIQGGNGGNEKNWYLTTLDLYRPEVGSYLSNMAINSQMFDLRLFERDTVTKYAKENGNNLWMINSYSRTKQNFSTDQLKSTAHLYVLRIGSDLYDKTNSNGSNTKFGIMGAYGHGTQTTSSNTLSRSSKGKVDGYLAGLYGTWFQKAENRTGWYVDTWFQYGWFDNKIEGQTLATEDYNTNGWSYSLEFGKTIPYHVTDKRTYSLQPKAQFIYSDLSESDHLEQNGTKISFKSTTNLMTRLGLRWMSQHNNYKKNNVFAEINWINNSNSYGISSLGDIVYQKGNKNLGEIRVGYEQKLNDRWHLGSNLNARFGSNNYRTLEGMISLEYSF